MNVAPISSINFTGKVQLKNINPWELHTYEAVKKLADDRNLDISITKRSKRVLLLSDIYNITATKSKSVLNREHTSASDKKLRGTSLAIMNKKASVEEISVKVFNAVINAIENLEKLH